MGRVNILKCLICGALGGTLGGFVALADAQVVSVNFGAAANDLAPADVAGVVAASNWNNGNTAGSGALAGVMRETGAATGVNVSYTSGSLSNNPVLTTYAGPNATGNNKMMAHAWTTGNDMTVEAWPTPSFVNFNKVTAGGSNGPRDNTITVSNLNALFPNGYDVYVYVAGANSGNNEANNLGTAGVSQFASPVHVLAGPGGANGLIQTTQNGNTTDANGAAPSFMNMGANNPGYSGLSIQDLANLPAGSQRTILWPTTLMPSGGPGAGGDPDGYYSARFDGFVLGALNAVDNKAIDLGDLSSYGFNNPEPNPQTLIDLPLNSDFGAGQPYQLFWDPAATQGGARGITPGNYIVFENMNFDTLDILARNIHGFRGTAGSSGGSDMGGIAGIQIVARAPAAAVPEPTSIALWSILSVVGLAIGARRVGRR